MKKIIVVALMTMFFGGMTFSSVAAVVNLNNDVVVAHIDDDKDKDKDKKKAATKSCETKSCATKKSCCSSKSMKTECNDKKSSPDKK